MSDRDPSVTRPTLIDTHAHLDDPAFDGDRDAVVARAEGAGVRGIVVIGYREAIWRRAGDAASRVDGGALVLGIHPQHAEEATPAAVERLRAAAAGLEAVGIGETGIDRFRDGPPLAAQQDAFRAQLRLAGDLGLPTIVHQRAAEEQTLEVLAEVPAGQAVVLHSFDAGPRTARLAIERGWSVGVGGLMTRGTSATQRDTLRDVPLASMVLETDCPYLVPNGARGRRNEPANLPLIAQRLSDLLGVPLDEVARQTTANARRLFRLAQR